LKKRNNMTKGIFGSLFMIVVWGIFLTMGLIIGMFYRAYLEKEIELNETLKRLNETLEYVNNLEMELAEKNRAIEMCQNKLSELNNIYNDNVGEIYISLIKT